MAKNGRYYRKKAKEVIGTKYDSVTEKRLHEGVLSGCQFHPEKISYAIEKTYEPDFSYRDSSGIEWLIEVKEILQDSAEAQKFQWIKKALKEDQILVFCISNPNQKIYWQKARKDGSKMTLSEWCDKQQILWFTHETIWRILK